MTFEYFREETVEVIEIRIRIIIVCHRLSLNALEFL